MSGLREVSPSEVPEGHVEQYLDYWLEQAFEGASVLDACVVPPLPGHAPSGRVFVPDWVAALRGEVGPGHTLRYVVRVLAAADRDCRAAALTVLALGGYRPFVEYVDEERRRQERRSTWVRS